MTTATQTATTALIVGYAENQIRQALREVERQSHLKALAAIEEHDINDPEGVQWRLDELTTFMREDLQRVIEDSDCPRSVIFAALMSLFVPGEEICTVSLESYATIEEVLSREQWIDHEDAAADETADE